MVVGAKVDSNYRLLVTTSGQITNISGNIVQVVNASGTCLCANISGDVVQISGQSVITSVSGNIVQLAGQFLITVTVSGDIVQISGQSVVTSVSGNIVSVINASGQVLNVNISGNSVSIAVPTLIRTGLTLPVTSASGGVVLSSGLTVSVVLKTAITNTGDIYIGGAGTNRPYSGFGYQLSQGEPIAIDINNFNAVFVVAIVSGDMVSFMGND